MSVAFFQNFDTHSLHLTAVKGQFFYCSRWRTFSVLIVFAVANARRFHDPEISRYIKRTRYNFLSSLVTRMRLQSPLPVGVATVWVHPRSHRIRRTLFSHRKSVLSKSSWRRPESPLRLHRVLPQSWKRIFHGCLQLAADGGFRGVIKVMHCANRNGPRWRHSWGKRMILTRNRKYRLVWNSWKVFRFLPVVVVLWKFGSTWCWMESII